MLVGGVAEGEGAESDQLGTVDVGAHLGHLRESGIEGHLPLDLSLRQRVDLLLHLLEVPFAGLLLVAALQGLSLDHFEGLLDGVLLLEQFD